jgi:hypothetical protein
VGIDVMAFEVVTFGAVVIDVVSFDAVVFDTFVFDVVAFDAVVIDVMAFDVVAIVVVAFDVVTFDVVSWRSNFVENHVPRVTFRLIPLSGFPFTSLFEWLPLHVAFSCESNGVIVFNS